jgi:hypothetical protein
MPRNRLEKLRLPHSSAAASGVFPPLAAGGLTWMG